MIDNNPEIAHPEEQKEEKNVKKKKPLWRRFLRYSVFFLIFVIIALVAFSSQVIMSKQSNSSWVAKLPIFKQIQQLAESADRELKGEERDRINILLLGMGGKNHDGGYLTDTIMIMSIEPSTKKVAMISIPRDLAVPIEGMGWKKINSVNAYAEREEPGSGGLATSQAVSDLMNVPIDYFLRVDFDGFINIIDKLGGIEVEVENTLDDYSYPVLGQEDGPWNSRYEHLHVEKGLQTMDGSLALKFARSRHGVGGEGSDFARAKRQQLIIQAAKDKGLKASNLLKPTMIAGIISELNEHVSTNLKIWEILKLKDMAEGIEKQNIMSKVIDNSAGGLLMQIDSADGAYLLGPRSGDFTEIQYFINNIFADAPAEQKSGVNEEKANIEVRNGTWINGLASKVSMDLEKYGFEVLRIGNSSRQNFQKSVIFDLTYGAKPKSLEILKEKTGANVSLGLPDWLLTEMEEDLKDESDPKQPDFLLIIGQDADATASGVENQESDPNLQ